MLPRYDEGAGTAEVNWGKQAVSEDIDVSIDSDESVPDTKQFMQRMMTIAWQHGMRPEVPGWDYSYEIAAKLEALDKIVGDLKRQNAELAHKLVDTMTRLEAARAAHLEDMRVVAMGRRPAESMRDIAERMKPEAAIARSIKAKVCAL